MRKILILRGGALGDFIVTLPAIAVLRQAWPQARIELTGNATAAQLALKRGLIDAVYSQHEARWSALYGASSLPPEFAAWLAEFDLIVNYWPDPEGDLRRRFSLRAGQKYIFAEAMPTRTPAAAHYCEALRELGLEPNEFFLRLDVASADQINPPRQDRIRDQGDKDQAPRRIAIHAGSGSPRKNWPIERWAELGRWLVRDCAAELIIITGEADEAALALASLGRHVHQLPLEDLVAELTRCWLFLGHDSGVSHLAAACGVPCVLLFGPTDPAMWAPPAPHLRVLQRGSDLNAISLADAQQAVLAAFADQV